MIQFCVQKTKCSRTAQSCKLDKNDNGYLFFLCNFNCCSTEIPCECHWRVLSMSENETENNSCRSSHHKVCIMGINEHWIHQQNEANSPTTKDASLYPHFASSSFHSSLNVNASSSFYRKPSPDITSEYDSWFIQRNCFFLQLIFAKSDTLIVLGSADAEAHAVQKSPTFCRINS